MNINRYEPEPLPSIEIDTVPALWRACVAAYGDQVAASYAGVSYTYRDLDARSARLARGLLAEGASKGSRIGALMHNSPEWLVAWLAISRIGGIAVGLSTFAPAAELAHLIPNADISILLSSERYLRHDYRARLPQALPGLQDADGKDALTLECAPFLRQIWLVGDAEAPWCRGSLADLELRGEAPSAYDRRLLEAVESQVYPADWGFMIYTSGSTALPKAVVHTQGVVVRKSIAMVQGVGIIPYKQRRGDRVIITNPLFWIGGFLSLSGALLRGATVIFADDGSPGRLFETVRRERATHISGSGALVAAVREAGGADGGLIESLRPHNTNQIPTFVRWGLTDCERFSNSLGMTETFGPHSGDLSGQSLPDDLTASVGPVLEGMEWKIVDPETGERRPPGEAGELCVRGDWLMAGMYKKERGDVFDADGFYHTGDQCLLRPDGYLLYDSRISGMIKTSGANVSPEEVELAIRDLPGVLEVAVVGLPDQKLGQMVVAAVVGAPGRRLDEDAVRRQALSRLSSFKAPKRVVFLDFEDIPRTPSNKVQKPKLAALLTERLALNADA